MARILKVSQLESRKRALVAESEVYRQALRLEIQNLRLYGLGAGRKLAQFKSVFVVIPLAASLIGIFSGRLFRKNRRSEPPGLLPTALTAWRFYQKFSPLFPVLMAQWFRKRRTSRTEDETPAPNI